MVVDIDNIAQAFRLLDYLKLGSCVELTPLSIFMSYESILSTYLTDSEKSPGLDSLILIKKPPSGLLAKSFSASALVILP